MTCKYFNLCGGCSYQADNTEYRSIKFNNVKKILSPIIPDNLWKEPVFIADGTRRRATFTFTKTKKGIALGFNEKASANIVSIDRCLLLRKEINDCLVDLKKLLDDICNVVIFQKKAKKQIGKKITGGDLHLCISENGIDVVLISSLLPNLEIREIIADHLANNDMIIRFSWQTKESYHTEVILEKNKPYILINGFFVYIPAGTFLQPSFEGETFLRDMVSKYLSDTEGKIADLFCGVGTFSYQLCRKKNIKILAADSSRELLDALQQSLNKNQISNVNVFEKNLFKYPLKDEIENCSAIVIDPPRAGASNQIKAICNLEQPPKKIIMISCNPHSMLKDCQILLSNNYKVNEISLLDQFVYSNHSEVIALFTK